MGEDDAQLLARLRREYPGWQIVPVASPAGWLALRQPTATAEHVLAGATLGELAARLAEAGE